MNAENNNQADKYRFVGEVSYVPLTEVCNPKQWRTIQKSDLLTEGYPVYGANGVIGYFDEFNHETETVLITCRGATCGTVRMCAPKSYVTGNAMCLDNLDEGIDASFLMHYLRGYDFSSIISGSAQPQITRASLRRVMVPVLDKKSQLEFCRSVQRVEKAGERLYGLRSKLDSLVKSWFVEMFENRGYPRTSIGDLVTSKVPSAKDSFNDADLIKYIDISSIDNSLGEVTKFTECIFGEAPSRAQQCVSFGDLLVSTVRPNLKNIAVTKLDGDNVVASSGFCVLRCVGCPVEYMKVIVGGDRFTREMCRLTTGANYPAIKNRDILGYMIPYPPMEQMDTFATFVQRVDKLRFAIQEQIEKLETLKASLMQEYFG